MPIPEITLNNEQLIPQVGFGVFQVPPEETKQAVHNALEAGYRHIDTAMIYGNEAAVGEAITESGIARDELYITTKCWNSDQGFDSALTAVDESLSKLGLDYLDLYLIHWPTPARDLYLDTWRAFEKIAADEKARSIGVSNFRIEDLQRVFDNSGVVPAVNQIELHPWLQQEELREFHAQHHIATEAWSPLARGGDFLNDPTLSAIAAEVDRSTAQVMLRWHIEIGNIVIPRTVNADRAKANLSLFDFELTSDQLKAIAGLDIGTRVGPDPADMNVA